MQQFNIGEAKAHLSDLVQKALLGEEIVIARDNKPVLRLVPIEPLRRTRQPGSGKGQLLHMSEDFDATPDDFAECR